MQFRSTNLNYFLIADIIDKLRIWKHLKTFNQSLKYNY